MKPIFWTDGSVTLRDCADDDLSEHVVSCPQHPVTVGDLWTITATEAQALAHASHRRPVHHEGIWIVRQDTGECGCECRLCYRDDECFCPLCTYDHDHSRRDAG